MSAAACAARLILVLVLILALVLVLLPVPVLVRVVLVVAVVWGSCLNVLLGESAQNSGRKDVDTASLFIIAPLWRASPAKMS